jgi:hypothetical protein
MGVEKMFTIRGKTGAAPKPWGGAEGNAELGI